MRASHYDTLGVAPSATADDIRQAYRRRSMAAHPDKGGTDEAMKAINQAYEVLGDPTRRARYDAGEDDEDANLAAAARMMLKKLFADALAAPEHVNIVRTVAREIVDAQNKAASKTAELHQRRKRLTTRRKKVRTKSGENLVHELIEEELRVIGRQLHELEDATAVVAAVKVLLNAYEHDEEPPPMTPRFSTPILRTNFF